MRNKLRNKGILSTLDSDDEFPDEHNEVAAVPDYLNDWRFDKIEFQWLEDNQIHGGYNKLLNSKNNELILKKGVMNEQDLYCLKTIANTCPNILVWYTNFIIFKDLQLPYNFLQSCLVTSYRKF